MNKIGNVWNNGTNVSFAFTNCIFVNATNIPSSSAGYNITNSNESAVFQEVGVAKHYLNDAFRNSGTANLPFGLGNELRVRTTYPPLLLSNVTLNGPREFVPVVQRDSDTVDCGYIMIRWIG